MREDEKEAAHFYHTMTGASFSRLLCVMEEKCQNLNSADLFNIFNHVNLRSGKFPLESVT